MNGEKVMSRRITRAFVEARVDTVNRLLGFEGEVGYGTIGALYLDGAYGGWAVYQWMNEHGGVEDLSGHGHATLRENATFLAGMIAGLRRLPNLTQDPRS